MDTSKKPIIQETHERPVQDFYRSHSSWINRVGQVLAVLVIVVLGVLIGRSIHHHSLQHKQAPKPVAVAPKKTVPSVPAKPKTAPSSNSSNSVTNNNGTASSTGVTGSTSTQLPNSGPGDVAAIFGASVLVAAGLHYALRSRQQN